MRASEIIRMGDRLKKMRLERTGMNQTEFADKCQINVVQYRRYENNKAIPRKEQLQKIADALGVEPLVITGYEYQGKIYLDDGHEMDIYGPDSEKFLTSEEYAAWKMSLLPEIAEQLPKTVEEYNANLQFRKERQQELRKRLMNSRNKNKETLLLKYFSPLNEPGKDKVIDYAKDIFGNPAYQDNIVDPEDSPE